MTDVALVGGGALLWIGLDQLSRWLPFVVLGSLLLLYGAAPLLVAIARRRR